MQQGDVGGEHGHEQRGAVAHEPVLLAVGAEEADVLVVNTCAFIDSAKEESIDAILVVPNICGIASVSKPITAVIEVTTLEVVASASDILTPHVGVAE